MNDRAPRPPPRIPPPQGKGGKKKGRLPPLQSRPKLLLIGLHRREVQPVEVARVVRGHGEVPQLLASLQVVAAWGEAVEAVADKVHQFSRCTRSQSKSRKQPHDARNQTHNNVRCPFRPSATLLERHAAIAVGVEAQDNPAKRGVLKNTPPKAGWANYAFIGH